MGTIPFNSPSILLKQYGRRVKEILHAEAFEDDFLKNQEFYLTLYHDENRILAYHGKGNTGNLKVRADDKGLHFSVRFSSADEFPDLTTATALIRNNVLRHCSFVYTADESNVEAIKYEVTSEGYEFRHVYKIESLTNICIARNIAAYQESEVHIEQTFRRYE